MDLIEHLKIYSQQYEFYFGLQSINIEYNDNYDYFESLLTKNEKNEYDSLKFIKKKIDWLSGRIAAKKAYLNYKSAYNISTSEISVLNGINRAPYILELPTVSISISHTEDLAISILSPNNVTVDIEKINPLNYSIINYFFTYNETKKILDIPEINEQTNMLYKLWTRKEAISKFLKLGMKMNLKSLDASYEDYFIYNNQRLPLKIISQKINQHYISLAVEKN